MSWFLHLKEVCYVWCCVRLSSVLILCSSCPAESKAVYLFLRSPVYYLEYFSCADLNWTDTVSVWIYVILKYQCHQDLSKVQNWDINNWHGVNKNQGKARELCASIVGLCSDHIVLLHEEKAFIKLTNPISEPSFYSPCLCFSASVCLYFSAAQGRNFFDLELWLLSSSLLLSHLHEDTSLLCLCWGLPLCRRRKEGLREEDGEAWGLRKQHFNAAITTWKLLCFGTDSISACIISFKSLFSVVLASSQSCSFLHLLLCSSVRV